MRNKLFISFFFCLIFCCSCKVQQPKTIIGQSQQPTNLSHYLDSIGRIKTIPIAMAKDIVRIDSFEIVYPKVKIGTHRIDKNDSLNINNLYSKD
jgi:hypothetical protein